MILASSWSLGSSNYWLQQPCQGAEKHMVSKETYPLDGNFPNLTFKPFSSNHFSTISNLSRCSLNVCENNKMSSKYTINTWKIRLHMTACIRRWKVDGPLQTLKGILRYSNKPKGIVNAVVGRLCPTKGSCFSWPSVALAAFFGLTVQRLPICLTPLHLKHMGSWHGTFTVKSLMVLVSSDIVCSCSLILLSCWETTCKISFNTAEIWFADPAKSQPVSCKIHVRDD